MKLDPKSHVPIFRQIAEELRSAIAAGVYQPQEALPSLRVLAQDVRVNPNTVQRAYELLEREGVVYARKGMGIFVAQQGKTSAIGQAESKARRHFRQSIEQALAASMTATQIRQIFAEELKRSQRRSYRRS